VPPKEFPIQVWSGFLEIPKGERGARKDVSFCSRPQRWIQQVQRKDVCRHRCAAQSILCRRSRWPSNQHFKRRWVVLRPIRSSLGQTVRIVRCSRRTNPWASYSNAFLRGSGPCGARPG